MVPTLGERMKAANPASRNVAVSGKDRGAVMMGGTDTDAIVWWRERRFETLRGRTLDPAAVAENGKVTAAVAKGLPDYRLPAWCGSLAGPVQSGNATIGTGRLALKAGDARAFRYTPRLDRSTLTIALGMSVLPSVAGPFGPGNTIPPSVPVGFAVTVAGVSPTATSLAFSPDGRALYVAAGEVGRVLRYRVIGGVLAGPPTVFLDGLTQPLGVLATATAVYVSDAVSSSTAIKGIVYRAQDRNGDGKADTRQVVIKNLPNGRHNTNGMAIGPDGMLYVTNGSSTDSGFGAEGGPAEVPPYTGSVLRVPPTASNLVPSPEMVVATGLRNIYDIAFFPAGHPAARPGTVRAVVSMNGPDGMVYNGRPRPAGEDTLDEFDTADGVVDHFGFPWCLYSRARGGLAGFTQDASRGSCATLPAAAFTGLVGPAARSRPSALFGLHVSADGIAFNPNKNFPKTYDGDLFVAEFGNFYGNTPSGHKVVRVHYGSTGAVASVTNFMSGVLPLDLTFAPDGALWIADLSGVILRVASLVPRSLP